MFLAIEHRFEQGCCCKLSTLGQGPDANLHLCVTDRGDQGDEILVCCIFVLKMSTIGVGICVDPKVPVPSCYSIV